MKRFWLFAYQNYYPCGGLNDFKGSYDTIRECYSHFDSNDRFVRMHILDTETMTIVSKGSYHDIDEVFNNHLTEFKVEQK